MPTPPMMPKKRTRSVHTARYLEQLKWIADHGGSREGYIQRYGSCNDPFCHGDGGEAIWEADQAELHRLARAMRGES